MLDVKAQKIWKSQMFKMKWFTNNYGNFGGHANNWCVLSTKTLKKISLYL